MWGHIRRYVLHMWHVMYVHPVVRGRVLCVSQAVFVTVCYLPCSFFYCCLLVHLFILFFILSLSSIFSSLFFICVPPFFRFSCICPGLLYSYSFSQNKNSEFCAPLTSFDWNETDPNLLAASSIDTTCTIWALEVRRSLHRITNGLSQGLL